MTVNSVDRRLSLAKRGEVSVVPLSELGVWWGGDVVPQIRWQIEVPWGEVTPDGYGIAYALFERDVRVCMPLPLNLIVGGWRAFVRWVRCPPWFSYERTIARVELHAYRRGLEDGRHEHWTGIRARAQ